MLGARDPLPRRPERVTVAGASGSGKSTLARRISEMLDLPYTEMDGLYHGPGWTPRPTFRDEVEAIAAGDHWITEWQYDSVRALLASRTDLLVWIDLPYPVVLSRVVRRTVGRRLRDEELWNGNREAPLHTIFTDREHVVRWSISSRHKLDGLVPAVAAERPDLPVVRLRSPRQVDRWLAEVVQPLA